MFGQLVCAATSSTREHEKYFFVESSERLQYKCRRPCQLSKSNTFCNRGGVASAENFWADGEMKFVYQAGAEHRIVQIPAAFAEQALHPPFAAQPTECRAEIDFTFAADFNFRSHFLESPT